MSVTERTGQDTISLNPYPGLRPYDQQDADLFFGREDQIHELLGLLRHTRFLAIVGESGCGKSSLIRAGLLPPLAKGFMTRGDSDWRIAVIRPGGNPIGNLATVLNRKEVLGGEDHDDVRSLGFSPPPSAAIHSDWLTLSATQTTVKAASYSYLWISLRNYFASPSKAIGKKLNERLAHSSSCCWSPLCRTMFRSTWC